MADEFSVLPFVFKIKILLGFEALLIVEDKMETINKKNV